MHVRIALGLILATAAFLRLYHLGSNPPSLYWDEVSLGYNAYSILQTARDEHGTFLPVATFPAFGDYKPPGYIYTVVPSIALFGLTEFAVRFPSAVFGIASVLLMFLLGRVLHSPRLGIVAACLLTLSPWHLQLTRGAFESNMATTLVLLGVYAWVKSTKANPWWALVAAASFALSMYTFNAQRLMAPIFAATLALVSWPHVKKNIRVYLACAATAVLLVLPLIPHLLSDEGQLRYREVNIFSDVDLVTKNVYRMEQDNSFGWPVLIHNRRLEYAYQFLDHYLDHFNGDFLFVRGDINPRLSSQVVGGLYAPELIFIVVGAYALFKKKIPFRWFLMAWLLVAPIPAGFARETPHALRALAMLPPLIFISSFGLLHLGSVLRGYGRHLVLLLPAILLMPALAYLHYYHKHYPIEYAGEWQYGYKQAVELMQNHPDKKVVMTTQYGRPYIYFLFYTRYDPRQFWQYRDKTYKDQYGVYWVTGFDRFSFREPDFSRETPRDDTLYIVGPGKLPPGDDIVYIRNLDGRVVFEAAVR